MSSNLTASATTMQKLTNNQLVKHLSKTILKKSINKLITIIGISGLDASGKSQLSKKLLNNLNSSGHSTLLFSGDSFPFPPEIKNNYSGRDWGKHHMNKTINFDLMVTNLLKPLKKLENTITLSILDFDNGIESTKTYNINYPVIILIESIYLFQPKIIEYLDLKIYLDITLDESLKRATSRSRDIRLYGSEKGVIEKYTNKNFEGHLLFEKTYEPRRSADIVIDNNHWQNPTILNQ